MDIRCGHAVMALGKAGMVEISGANGPYSIKGRRVLVATGVYEKPYVARSISGTRPFGILTTGAPQRFVCRHKQLPCWSPIVMGSELIAYSTILTLRRFGVRPVAFNESARRCSSQSLRRSQTFDVQLSSATCRNNDFD
jgi:hypothetical protein